MASPLKGTEFSANAIERVKYSHDAMIDLIIVDPGIPQGMLARHFGYTQAWVSRILGSDAFQARLAERRSELCDPTLVATVEERLRSVTMQSLDIVMEKLEASRSTDLAVKTLEISTRALGYGARDRGVQVNVQNNYVVPLPTKSQNSAEWMAEHNPNAGQTFEHDGASIPHTPAPVIEQKPQARVMVPAVGTGEQFEVK